MDDQVHVDRLGVPAGRMAGPVERVLVLGVPETARQRLLAAGVVELREQPEDAGAVNLVLVSTRLRRADLSRLLAPARASGSCPLVVLAHTGGEALAVEIMRMGATGVVAEGNEAALGSFLAGTGHDATLLESYDRQVPDRGGGEEADRDAVTGLPGASAFTGRVAELAQSGDVPRIGYARILHLDDIARRLSPAATALLRRRLGTRYRELARAAGVELFALSQRVRPPGRGPEPARRGGAGPLDGAGDGDLRSRRQPDAGPGPGPRRARGHGRAGHTRRVGPAGPRRRGGGGAQRGGGCGIAGPGGVLHHRAGGRHPA